MRLSNANRAHTTTEDEMKLITAAEIIYMRRHNRVVYVYPRKHEVSVDGFKGYRITANELAALKQANNGFVN